MHFTIGLFMVCVTVCVVAVYNSHTAAEPTVGHEAWKRDYYGKTVLVGGQLATVASDDYGKARLIIGRPGTTNVDQITVDWMLVVNQHRSVE